MFHFKQFSLSDDETAMKVGTDAVLLGAWADVGKARSILDIGTGSGILALMMAQRSEARIDAVEIDPKAAAEARQNVAISPWSERIIVHGVSFQEFVARQHSTYDLVISNPPYYSNSLKPTDPGRRQSRHNDLLPLSELMKGTSTLLARSGRATFILPTDDGESWIREASLYGLFPVRSCLVVTREGKPSGRLMMEFSKSEDSENPFEKIFIRDKEGNYSTQYKQLTADFYLGL